MLALLPLLLPSLQVLLPSPSSDNRKTGGGEERKAEGLERDRQVSCWVAFSLEIEAPYREIMQSVKDCALSCLRLSVQL